MIDMNVQSMPTIALRGLVVFPHTGIHFDVGRAPSVQAVHEALGGNRLVFLTAQHDVRISEPTGEQLNAIGCIARISHVLRLAGDGIRVMVEGLERGQVVAFEQSQPFFKAKIAPLPAIGVPEQNDGLSKALVRAIKEAFTEYAQVNTKLSGDVVLEVAQNNQLEKLTDYIACHVPFTPETKQELLAEIHVYRRGEQLVSALTSETQLLQLELEIEQKVRESMDANQRDYYLREQLQAIAEELGEDDNPKQEAEEYRLRIEALDTSPEIKNKLFRETNKLSKMPANSHDGSVLRTYLDTVLELPFGVMKEECTSIQEAKDVLDQDHYGLQKVKERILELLAVRSLAPDIKGQILCLVGPPGVGKTSVAQSIARCMHREFVRISLGGVRDEADIRGHRRTYIGSMPGRLIASIRKAGCMNPLILMDEIDKLGSDYKGDPSSALLEVLDPEQNHTFEDHYLEIPFDLSHAMFVLTANDLEAIPAALRDRMEIIHLGSYTREEKYQIARRHLIPKQMKRHGLTGGNFRISSAGLYGLIDGYVKEAGVRNLERVIASLCRKGAKQIVSGEQSKVSVKASNLTQLLGPRKFKPDVPNQKGEVGLVNGLAWTQVGGELLPIETAVFSGTGKIQLTGSLGEVMKESAAAAISCIRSRAHHLAIPKQFYSEYDIHIHAPEGAVPKDGPSAGIAMATAVLSAFCGCPVRGDVAMTGEITIRGTVLPIGGLKEKSMAAYKAGIKTVILPKDNLADLEEVDDIVKDNVKFVGVSRVEEVFPLAFAGQEYLVLKPTQPTNEVLPLPKGVDNRLPGYCQGGRV